jgi:hypothetical protein
MTAMAGTKGSPGVMNSKVFLQRKHEREVLSVWQPGEKKGMNKETSIQTNKTKNTERSKEGIYY